MAKKKSRTVAPKKSEAQTTADGSVMPRRPKNADVRGREHLLPEEVKALRKAAAAFGRHGHRDSTMILVAYVHGLRAAELVALRWDQVHLKERVIDIRRVKKGSPSTHPLTDEEVKALRALDGERTGPVFVTERGTPLTTSGFLKIVSRAGENAKIGMPVHPHMLRHGCGYLLANAERDTRAIQDWLGHINIQHTVRYTKMAPNRFKSFWPEDKT